MTIDNFEGRFTPLSDAEREQLKVKLNAEWGLEAGYKGGYVDGSGFHPLNEVCGPVMDVNSLYPVEWRES